MPGRPQGSGRLPEDSAMIVLGIAGSYAAMNPLVPKEESVVAPGTPQGLAPKDGTLALVGRHDAVPINLPLARSKPIPRKVPIIWGEMVN